MATLSEIMCEKIGLSHGATAADLMAYLREGGNDVLDGLLATESSKAAAERFLTENDTCGLEVVDQIGGLQQKYCSVQFESPSGLVHVALVSDQMIENPPTDLENLIFFASIDRRLEWHRTWREEISGPVVDWRKLAKGKAIIVMPPDLPEEGLRLICALFGLKHPDVTSSSKPPAIASSASAITIGACPDTFNLTKARLLFEAASAEHPKWRCLSLYRILEHAYLTNIKKALIDKFDKDANEALKSAVKDLANEMNQLVALAERANLTSEFTTFNFDFDALLAANNQFIIKLDKGAEKETFYSATETYKKGVLRFYKLRCSIAHAGTSSVIFEQFKDSNEAALTLLPSIEAIALKSLKMRIF